MNNRDQAQKLSSRIYTTVVFLDETTDGDSVYVAIHPELEGCVAQGDTVKEAQHNLDETRVDFILHLLEHNLPVPEPRSIVNSVIYASANFAPTPPHNLRTGQVILRVSDPPLELSSNIAT